MKKLLFSFILFSLTIGYAQAQFRFGIKAGANFSTLSTKVDTLKKSCNGFQFGIAPQLKIPLLGLGIQPEILYTINSGEKLSDYINIPVNIRWQPLPLPLIKPVILAGPYFGYAVNIKEKNMITPVDWGIGIGAGVEVWKLQVEARYSLGLKNVSKSDLLKLKNSKFSLSLVYFL
ncbi:MAG: PorT family protein [Prevotellaceae bacterium]|jgi:hypothetical protein|nr:PorT family protein [Prevotellaceae bacterium]